MFPECVPSSPPPKSHLVQASSHLTLQPVLTASTPGPSPSISSLQYSKMKSVHATLLLKIYPCLPIVLLMTLKPSSGPYSLLFLLLCCPLPSENKTYKDTRSSQLTLAVSCLWGFSWNTSFLLSLYLIICLIPTHPSGLIVDVTSSRKPSWIFQDLVGTFTLYSTASCAAP